MLNNSDQIIYHSPLTIHHLPFTILHPTYHSPFYTPFTIITTILSTLYSLLYYLYSLSLNKKAQLMLGLSLFLNRLIVLIDDHEDVLFRSFHEVFLSRVFF